MDIFFVDRLNIIGCGAKKKKTSGSRYIQKIGHGNPKQMSTNLGKIPRDDFMPRHVQHTFDKDMGNGASTGILAPFSHLFYFVLAPLWGCQGVMRCRVSSCCVVLLWL